jgi:WhiB family redox-sensing transcriptional regulator
VTYFEELAARLDRFAHVPDDVLFDIVTGEGACTQLYASGLEPEWTNVDLTDRELAARICAGCTARWACLELELRTHGDQSLGVWGALPAEDIRTLYPVWLARRPGGERL